MTAVLRGRPVPVPGPTAAPLWVTGESDVPERMLTLTLRVAVSLGRSQRQRIRLCRSVLRGPGGVRIRQSTVDTSGWVDPGRRARVEVLAALRSELGPRVDRVQLDAALQNAVALDEMMLLPPRQRFALWAAALAHETVTDIVGRTGWTPGQVARLLRVALQTITTHARI